MARERHIAKILLETHAVTLNIDEPYTYVSGIRSPIYCDNRVLTFFPKARKVICQEFYEMVLKMSPDVIVGTASSAISWAAWVSEKLELPMGYIRKTSKGYGRQKLIEGGDVRGKRVVVIEDLVSTGGSSLNAVEACRDAGAEVLAMVAIFTYQFEQARQKFADADCDVRFLTNFSTLLDIALQQGYIGQADISVIQEWNTDPQNWGPKHGFPNAPK